MSHRHKFRRRNPSRTTGELRSVLEVSAGATVGAVASRIVPQLIGAELNSGMLGYAANIAVPMLLYAFLPWGMFSLGAVSGGIAATAMRILNDNYLPGMGLGAYWPSYFAVPTVSNSIGQTLTSPYPARVA